MRYSDIQSIDDVKQWLVEHPNHIIASAWNDMIYDMDTVDVQTGVNGEDYTLEDFQEEAGYQMFSHAGSLDPDEVNA